ncbi:sulfatase [Planctomycetes bacterium TBK1r]|uniref:Choline-sulfatase n=1 Tax=Stieleria magnilauensis TaxID=2527963 RepID=A0ABX5XUD5_9BACT|nr:Choline-sulfatase [Planctomycetes bacterium TBK1r]
MIYTTRQIICFACLLAFSQIAHSAERPNVILITVDDLNDWIEPLGGHPNAKTPVINQFCKSAIVFRNAVCPAPVCGPSRSAFLSGFMPQHTGVYDNGTNMRDSPLVQENATLPEYFSRHGYYTLSTGKVFHSHRTPSGEDYGHWAFDNYFPDPLWDNPDPTQVTDSQANKINGKAPAPLTFDGKTTKGMLWGPTQDPDFENTKDYSKVRWANQYLSGDEPLQEPFFMAVGIYKPHVPWFVPQRFFDLHPLESVAAPYVNPSDLDDIKRANGQNVFKPMEDYQWVNSYGLERQAARAYLAAISEADLSLGILLDQLEKSKFADNTIVVIMGDHGWHLGEKLRYHKQTLWAEAVLTPLIVRTPAIKSAVAESSATGTTFCDNPVNLVDVFPTLIDLCGLEKKPNLDGSSFSGMLSDPAADTGSVAVTVSAKGTSVLSKRWHYIENRSKGHAELLSQEIYDRENDPYEEKNLIDSSDPEVRAAIATIRRHAPHEFAKSVEVKRKGKPGPKQLDDTIKRKRAHLQ